MTKADLINLIAEKANITRVKAETVVNTIFDSMVEALMRNDRIEIRGFGSFVNRDYGVNYLSSSLTLESEPLTLEITAPDEAARRDLFERAAKAPSLTQALMRELRFVQDERAPLPAARPFRA